MIDTKKLEELISKGNELGADCDVCSSIGEFISANIDRYKQERDYLELRAWMDALEDITNKLEVLSNRLGAVTKQVKQMI